jgi:hypothetical protein
MLETESGAFSQTKQNGHSDPGSPPGRPLVFHHPPLARTLSPVSHSPGRDPSRVQEKKPGDGLSPPIASQASGRSRSIRWLEAVVPPNLNLLAQLGAIANTCLIVALISGIALLVWYVPSAHQAYASLETLKNASWLGQWVRSLHRYSSDACMFMILLHAGQIFFQRRFTGGRWIAWVTGVILLVLVWVIGWTGYWLVWDVRAQHVALGTARFMDSLPLFAEPLSRSFLTNDSVPSLLFFLIFFAHMLLPLLVGVALWMHLMRVHRASFLTGPALTFWVVGSLVLLSALLPATSASPADMSAKVQRFTMDWWYLWPLLLTDRLSGGMLWALFLFASLLLLTVPWWMTRKRLFHILQRNGQPANLFPLPGQRPLFRLASATAISIALSGVVFALSNLAYSTPHSPQPELVVSFNHQGRLLQERALTQEELDKRLPHMRAQFQVTREKSPVRLRVTMNGRTVWEESYPPKGLSRDGPSIALVRLPVSAGIHEIKIDLADSPDPELWTLHWQERIEFEPNQVRVLLFNTRSGFSLH